MGLKRVCSFNDYLISKEDKVVYFNGDSRLLKLDLTDGYTLTSDGLH